MRVCVVILRRRAAQQFADFPMAYPFDECDDDDDDLGRNGLGDRRSTERTQWLETQRPVAVARSLAPAATAETAARTISIRCRTRACRSGDAIGPTGERMTW